jgi:hypothetical protein
MTMKAAAAPAAAWRNRIVGHADVAPAELVPNPRNWRSHPQEQQRALAGALGEVGWVAEVLVNRTTGHVVDGHLRIELALARHEATVPVTYVELSEDEERLVLLFSDAATSWASHVDRVERLASLAEAMASTGGPMARSRRSTRAAGGSLTERAAERVATLTDDARVRAYEILGDRPRAVEIMERRLLAD